jgi:hypothetical protein
MCLKVGITRLRTWHQVTARLGNRRELVSDLVVKAKQIEFLVNSLPVPEPEEVQVYTLAHPVDMTLDAFKSGKAIASSGRRHERGECGICTGGQSS